MVSEFYSPREQAKALRLMAAKLQEAAAAALEAAEEIEAREAQIEEDSQSDEGVDWYHIDQCHLYLDDSIEEAEAQIAVAGRYVARYQAIVELGDLDRWMPKGRCAVEEGRKQLKVWADDIEARA